MTKYATWMNQGKRWRSTKHGYSFTLLGIIAALGLVLFSPIHVFAQETKIDSNFTVVAGEELKKNPTAVQILKNIEIAKQRLAEMQNAEKQKTEHEKFVDEQRRIAQELLEKDLNRMNKNYEEFTPRNSFARFVSNFNQTHQGFYWDQFDYMNEKIKIAKQAKQAVLNNGGNHAVAHAEFVKYASMTRAEMISYVSELNIKHELTDSTLQSYFDKNGKLPRYENDDVAICYGCEKYENVKAQILAEHERIKTSQRT